MDLYVEVCMATRKFRSIEERLNFIEFRQQLLFDNDEISRILFENQITEAEYCEIMDLMDDFRAKIDRGEKVHHGSFEQQMYDILPCHKGDYHLCEYIARAFWEERRWEEVFPALYGGFPKYSHLFENEN